MKSEIEQLSHKVRKIEITAKRQVLDLFSGMYASAFKGRGIELEDVREFQIGDDVRAINWAKTAQLGRPFVKEFREERDLTVMLLVDMSASLAFGSHYETKHTRLAEVGALLAFSAIYNHDRVGLILFSENIQKEIAPRRGLRHGARLIRELIGFQPTGGKTSLAQTLDAFNMAVKKRCICFLLSDFISQEDSPQGFEKQFGYTAKHDDLVAIRVVDPYEKTIPKLGLSQMQDLESGLSFIVDVNADVVKTLQEKAQKDQDAFESLGLKYKAGTITIDTQSSFVERIAAYFKMRKEHRR